MSTERIFIAPAWFGEFGWEVMSWAPWCRARARRADRAIITSFAASRALYADFATDFIDHGAPGRSLKYPKGFDMYRSGGPDFEHVRYGNRDTCPVARDSGPLIAVHARGIARKASINYSRWPELLAMLTDLGGTIAMIGTFSDGPPVTGHGPRTTGHEPRATVHDCRGLPLGSLMDLLAGAAVTVGCSSGTMHLAAACGCDLVVWGDRKTRYRETLEQRYKETWNPHRVRVEWLDADDWQPDAGRVVAAVERIVKREA